MSGDYRSIPTRSRTPSADSFVLTLWTDDPELARRADDAGVDRIGVDLERIGKHERQRGLGTWISPHRLEDLESVGVAISHAELFARVNPLHDASPGELEAVLARGARVVMLPMVASAREAREFVRLVRGTATTVLLVESREGIGALPELVAIEGIDEVHIGLNDLALSLGSRNRWIPVAEDVVLGAAAVVHTAGRRFGFGAVGRPGDTDLPVPVELVYAEYARAGATAALLSRSFFRPGAAGDLHAEIAQLRAELAAWTERADGDLAAAHAELALRAASTDRF
jgi:HpcH/HpaI aldolase/citrate lyase family